MFLRESKRIFGWNTVALEHFKIHDDNPDTCSMRVRVTQSSCMKAMVARRGYILAELCVLMVGMPIALMTVLPLGALVLLLWGTTLYVYVLQWKLRPAGVHHHGWQWQVGDRGFLRPMLLRLAFCSVLMVGLTVFFMPEKLFVLVHERPLLWAMVMVLYPLLSVVPQEIIFRHFFFWRYASVFRSPFAMILASGLLFGFVHIIFQNWVAPSLCVIGGWMFAHTYHKTRSLPLVTLEHALYGCMVFTVGLGRYFYHGAVGLQ
jgi:membrane protease YdiL (CAAX protease family)